MPRLCAVPALFQPCLEGGEAGTQIACQLSIGCPHRDPYFAAALDQAHIHALLALVELELNLPRGRRRGRGYPFSYAVWLRMLND